MSDRGPGRRGRRRTDSVCSMRTVRHLVFALLLLATLPGVATAQPEEVVDGRFLIDSVACKDLEVLDGLNVIAASDPLGGLDAFDRLAERAQCIEQREDQWIDILLSSSQEHPLHGWRVQVSYPGARVWWWAYAAHVARR